MCSSDLYEVASDYSLYSDQDIASGFVEPFYNFYVRDRKSVV